MKAVRRAETGHADDGVGGRAARGFHRRTHGVVDRLGARLVDQRHAAFAHFLLHEEVVLGAGDHVDDGVADTEDVVTKVGHGKALCFWPARIYNGRTPGGNLGIRLTPCPVPWAPSRGQKRLHRPEHCGIWRPQLIKDFETWTHQEHTG